MTNLNNFVRFIHNIIVYFVIFSDNEGSVVSALALSLGLNIL